MNEHGAELIQRSWSGVSGARDELARSFYRRLFELDPRIEDLFAVTDMQSQHGKLIAMMDEIVRLAPHAERLHAVLIASGERHRGYGVLPRHYRTVGEALLWALERVTPGGLDDEARAAWAEWYTHVARVMQCGAQGTRSDDPGS